MRRLSLMRSVMLITLLMVLITANFGTAQKGMRVLDQGTLIVQQGETQLGQGMFTLVQLNPATLFNPATLQLVDHMRLEIPQGPTVTLAATLRTDGRLHPFSYVLNMRDPQGLTTIIVRIENGSARLLWQRGETTRTKVFQSEEGFVLIDNNLFGQLALLYRRVHAQLEEGERFNSTAIVPQTEEAFPLRAERAEPAEILHQDETLTVDRISVTLNLEEEPQRLELLGVKDRFIGMASPTAQIPTVYRSDLFPGGFTIKRP